MEENTENVQLGEKEARKQRLKERRLARRAKRNARIARGRLFKNIIIWLLGVIFLPIAIVGASFIVPISVITGNNGEYVSEDLSKRSVFEAVKLISGDYGNYGFADFPIIAKSLKDLEDTDIGDGKTLGGIIRIDADNLNAIKFGDGDIADKIRDCVEVIATIESVGGADLLGDFGALNVFTDAEEVGTVDSIDKTAEDFDAKQYYYKTAEGEYLRAFKDDGSNVDGLADTETLYYPPLNKVRLSELVNIIDDAFGRLEINSLLETFHASNETLTKILGEHTKVKDLADFDIKGVYLNDVMPKTTENATLYDILQDLTETEEDSVIVRKNYDEITIGNLSENFDTDKIKLTTVIPNTSAQTDKLYGVLADATGIQADAITLSDLKTLDTDNVHLSEFLDVPTEENDYKNQTIYKVLLSALTSSEISEYTDITLSSLVGFTVGKILLNDVMPYDSATNGTLYDILKNVTSKNNDEITIGDISNFDKTKIKLTTVLPETGNEDLYKILVDLVADASTADDITIGNLSAGLTPSNIHLTTVLPAEGNETLYKILRDATGVSGETDAEKNNNITLNSLSSFTPANLHLNTVLEDVDLTDNNVLLALKEQNDGQGILVSEIGSAINELSLYEVYGKTAFTETPIDGARRFNRVDDASGKPLYYDYDENGDYYLKNNAGIWLILCFDTAEYDTSDNVITRYKDADGNPTRYIIDDMQIKDLQTGSGSGFSRKFKNATLKQLIDTGLVDNDTGLSNDIKTLSLQEVITILADPTIQAYIAAMH